MSWSLLSSSLQDKKEHNEKVNKISVSSECEGLQDPTRKGNDQRRK